MTDPRVLDDVPERAVAVYAHPDDHEVTCGGTLARWAAGGCEVHVVVAARGDKGSDDATCDTGALAEARAGEVRAAADALGVAGVELLGHADGELDVDQLALRREVVGVLRRLRPDTVVCPDPTAVFFGDGYVSHVDHRAIGWATLDAVAPAASSPLYFTELGAPHHVSTVLLSPTLEPDMWVDVTSALDAKVAAVLAHRTQLAGDADEWLPDFVRQRAEEEGRRAGLPTAEAFRRLRFGG